MCVARRNARLRGRREIIQVFCFGSRGWLCGLAAAAGPGQGLWFRSAPGGCQSRDRRRCFTALVGWLLRPVPGKACGFDQLRVGATRGIGGAVSLHLWIGCCGRSGARPVVSISSGWVPLEGSEALFHCTCRLAAAAGPGRGLWLRSARGGCQSRDRRRCFTALGASGGVGAAGGGTDQAPSVGGGARSGAERHLAAALAGRASSWPCRLSSSAWSSSLPSACAASAGGLHQ